jgi:CubicO group peptidase (beta-lactamase class C family)
MIATRPAIDQLKMKADVDEILNRHAAVGMAVGVVRHGRLESFQGRGLADIATNRPITEDTVFRIASITKTFTTIAVLQLWERGLVDLDAPADAYLRAYKLIPARPGFRPATLRHLLTHTAGVPQVPHPWRALTKIFGSAQAAPSLGDHFKFGQPIPTLAEYYGGALHLVAEPGTRFTYSDHSIATAGQIVEDVSGEPLDRYFRERIFEPLGMADSDFVRSEKVKSHLATGYDLGSRGTKAVPDVVHVTSAASAIYSTPRDMARYVAALLGGGGNEHGSVLKPATVRTMFEPHYQTDPRLPGMGLGFWRFDLGGHLAVEHEGLLPGFNSQIFLAPEDGIGVIAFTNGARGALMWLPAEVGTMLRRLLDVQDDAIRTDVPHHPEIWAELCGRYPLSARLTDTQARALVGLGAEVFVRRGTLMIRSVNPIPVLYRGFALHPDDDKDPYAFRIDLSRFGIGTTRVVFSREPGPGTTRLHLELVPLSLKRQRPRTGPLLG